MNAQKLQELYEHWRQASGAERQAILAGSWQEMSRLQQEKNDLKRRIVATTEEWQNRWSLTGETRADYEERFRPVVDELISLEAHNLSLLASKRAELQQQLAATNRTISTLRGVQRSYGEMAATSAWASYS